MLPYFLFFLWLRVKIFWIKVGKIYGIEPRLLYSIAKVESDLDRYVVAFSFNKMSPKQVQEPGGFLTKIALRAKQHTQVIARSEVKNKFEASKVVHFHTNNYPRFDMGIMQINSIHKPLLDKAGISFYDLFDPKNQYTGADLQPVLNGIKTPKMPSMLTMAKSTTTLTQPKSLKSLKLCSSYQSGKTQLYYRNLS